MSKQKKPKHQTQKFNKSIVMVPILLIALIGLFFINKNTPDAGNIMTDNGDNSKETGNRNGETALSENGDLVIPTDALSSTATYYPVEIEGTTVEVLAVKAPDGTVRTAFNTCQICYSSGRGYFKQENDVLVCQNCGNRYDLSEVEVTRGGCNPVPIFSEDKTIDEDSITISKEFLTESKDIFANWKSDF